MQKNDFMAKHHLRPMSTKSSRNSQIDGKSSQHQRSESNLKSLKSIKEYVYYTIYQ